MTTQRLRTMWLARLITTLAISLAFTARGSAQLLRNFDSLPTGDSLTAADGVVGGVGTGGVLGTEAPPGGGGSSFDNRASTGTTSGFGTDNPTYGGSYQISNANLVASLGTSLTNFTIAFAYKLDTPNLPSASVSARLLRLVDPNTGVTMLQINSNGRRQNVQIVQPLGTNTVQYAFGNSTGGLGQQIMDGDPATVPNVGGTFDSAHATEWVFFAMTYETVGTSGRVTQYGQVPGGTLLQYHQNTLNMNTNDNGTTLGLTDKVLEFGNALFRDSLGNPTFRPFDAAFDNLGIYPTALSLAQLQALGTAVFTAPVHVNGDYNNNGTVDAADYVVWLKNVGQTGTNPADGDGDLTVDNDDYQYWRARFGNPSPGSGSSEINSGTIPEPTSMCLLLLCLIPIASHRRRQTSRLRSSD